jgi:hypothetical protein
MRTGRKLLLALVALAAGPQAAMAQDCAMKLDYAGPGGTPIWKSQTGTPSFYFKSNSDVNTDGSGRSYHPNDIEGTTGLAQNTICNAVRMKTAGGVKACAGPAPVCQPCIKKFKSVDQATMLNNFTDYFVSFAIATAGKRACVVPQGQPNAGYFVSTTSYSKTNPQDSCDPKQYLDSMVFPSIAVPDSLIARGVKKGDFVVVRNSDNGRRSLGVVGDTSGGRIGESSIATNRQLKCQKNQPGCVAPPIPNSKKESYTLVVERAEYLIFPGTVSSWPASPAEVDGKVVPVFQAWGDVARLDACSAAYGRPR